MSSDREIEGKRKREREKRKTERENRKRERAREKEKEEERDGVGIERQGGSKVFPNISDRLIRRNVILKPSQGYAKFYSALFLFKTLSLMKLS